MSTVIGEYPRSAAQQFIDEMSDRREHAIAQATANRLGGVEVCHMSYRFRDMSACYLTDQAGWRIKG